MTQQRFTEIKKQMESLYDASLAHGGSIAAHDAYWASLSAAEQAEYKELLWGKFTSFPGGTAANTSL